MSRRNDIAGEPTESDGVDVRERQPHYPPFYEHLGLNIDQDGSVAISVQPQLTNSRGALHGGAVASMLDAALAAAVRNAVPPGTQLATIDLSIHYLGPGEGPCVRASATVLRVGGRIAYATGQAYSEKGAVAHAVGSFSLRRPPGAPGDMSREPGSA